MSSLPRQRFMEHLDALRGSLTGAAFAWVLGMIAVAVNFEAALRLIKEPLAAIHGAQLVTFNPLVGLFIACNIVTAGGAIIAAPLMILYLLKFFIPALKPNEKKILGVVALAAVLLFSTGAAFGFFWMLPMTFKIALQIQQALGFKLLWSAEDYFSLVVTLPLIMGAAFCLPLVVAVLLRLRILNYHALVKRWDVATLVILVAAVAICPSGDPVSFLFIAAPLAVLYALALVLGRPRNEPAPTYSM